MKVQVPRFLTLFFAVILIALFFLPIMKSDKTTESAIDSVSEMAEELQMETTTEVGGLSLKELKSISLFKLTKVSFSDGGVSGNSDNDKLAGGMFASIGVVSVLIALVALCKRPILTLLFDLIGVGAYALISYAIEEAFKSSYGYGWGIAHTLYIPLFIVIAIGAIWMFIAKKMDKKAARLQRG